MKQNPPNPTSTDTRHHSQALCIYRASCIQMPTSMTRLEYLKQPKQICSEWERVERSGFWMESSLYIELWFQVSGQVTQLIFHSTWVSKCDHCKQQEKSWMDSIPCMQMQRSWVQHSSLKQCSIELSQLDPGSSESKVTFQIISSRLIWNTFRSSFQSRAQEFMVLIIAFKSINIADLET